MLQPLQQKAQAQAPALAASSSIEPAERFPAAVALPPYVGIARTVRDSADT